MKRILLLVAILAVAFTAKAEVEFAYEAGAELVSAYLWRGQYNGGLSFQPNLTIGYEGEKTSFSIGAWGSVGASDWGFRKEGDPSGETYFVPEIDILGSFTFFNVTLGFTHYYYFGGSKFLCWDKLEDFDVENNTSSTEVQIGFNFADILPENHNLYFNWYTMVAGKDFVYDEITKDPVKRAYSSYLELGYDYTFDAIGLTLGAQVGLVPWASDFYGTEDFAVKCVSLKLNKMWEFDACELDLFAQGMVDTYDIDNSNTFIKASGDEKICNQKLNGCIGLGIWF